MFLVIQKPLMKLNTEHRISGFGELFLLDMVIWFWGALPSVHGFLGNPTQVPILLASWANPSTAVFMSREVLSWMHGFLLRKG